MQTGFHTETVVSIKKKLVMIKNRMPFSADMKRYFADIERREWILRKHADRRKPAD